MKERRNRGGKSMTNTKGLTETVALVTGGSRGIGAAIAKRLAGDGARVAITYKTSPEKAGKVTREIEAACGDAQPAQPRQVDRGDLGAPRRLVAVHTRPSRSSSPATRARSRAVSAPRRSRPGYTPISPDLMRASVPTSITGVRPCTRRSRSVGRLVRARLLQKLPDPEDARAIKVALTQKGGKLIQHIAPALRAVNDRLFANMSSDDMAMLDRLLRQIVVEGGRLVDGAAADG